jgi:hypothetical protein
LRSASRPLVSAWSVLLIRSVKGDRGRANAM